MPLQTRQSDFAAVPQRATIPGSLIPLGYQQITATALAFALTIPQGAFCAIIEAEAFNVRWRDDGTAPTATVGMLLAAGASITYQGNLAKFQGIAAAAGAIVNVTYYG